MHLRRLTLTTLLAAAGAATVAASPATALSGTVPASALKAACEQSPGNVVNLTDGVKVEGGSASVTTGCTINIPETKALEVVRAQLAFAGPLKVAGAAKTKVELVEQSRFQAPSIELDLSAFESEVKVDRSQLVAGTGGVKIAMGDIAKAQFAYASAAGATIDSSGPLSFSAGGKLTMELNEVTLRGGGVTLGLNGPDSVVKAERAILETRAAGQSLLVSGAGAKTLIEAKESRFSAHADTRIALAGAESALKTVATELSAGGLTDVGVSVGSGNGLIEMTGPGGLVQGRRVVIDASSASQKGKVIHKLGTARAGAASPAPDSELIYRTGELGTTEVAESTLSGADAVRITSGQMGVCKQEKNIITAPVKQLCTAAAAPAAAAAASPKRKRRGG